MIMIMIIIISLMSIPYILSGESIYPTEYEAMSVSTRLNIV